MLEVHSLAHEVRIYKDGKLLLSIRYSKADAEPRCCRVIDAHTIGMSRHRRTSFRHRRWCAVVRYRFMTG